jgi:hypothetical protein
VSFVNSMKQLRISYIPRSSCEFRKFHGTVASFVKFHEAVVSFVNSTEQLRVSLNSTKQLFR